MSDTSNIQVDRKWLLGAAATIVVAVVGGYVVLYSELLEGVERSVSELRTETGDRIEGREREDQQIRNELSGSVWKLRTEIGGLTGELRGGLERLGDRMVASDKELGDRLVASDKEIGLQISELRGFLLETVRSQGKRIDNHFQVLDGKIDELRQRISLQQQGDIAPEAGDPVARSALPLVSDIPLPDSGPATVIEARGVTVDLNDGLIKITPISKDLTSDIEK